MRTRRQAKRNLIVIFQRITTKDIKGNKKGTSTNPKPKILFLFLSFFFFPSSPVPHFSAALVIPSLNWNLAFLFPHFLTNKTNLPLLQPPTTECIQKPNKSNHSTTLSWISSKSLAAIQKPNNQTKIIIITAKNQREIENQTEWEIDRAKNFSRSFNRCQDEPWGLPLLL